MEKIADLSVLKNMLCECIAFGIDEDGEIREFDILDYYEMTDIPIEQLVSILNKHQELTTMERKILSPFAGKYKAQSVTGYQQFMKMRMEEKLTIGEIAITTEMKVEAFTYLIDRNIPINYKTYNTAIRRKIREITREAESR